MACKCKCYRFAALIAFHSVALSLSLCSSFSPPRSHPRLSRSIVLRWAWDAFNVGVRQMVRTNHFTSDCAVTMTCAHLLHAQIWCTAPHTHTYKYTLSGLHYRSNIYEHVSHQFQFVTTQNSHFRQIFLARPQPHFSRSQGRWQGRQ